MQHDYSRGGRGGRREICEDPAGHVLFAESNGTYSSTEVTLHLGCFSANRYGAMPRQLIHAPVWLGSTQTGLVATSLNTRQ